MKGHKHESLAQNDRFLKIEKETELFLQTRQEEQNESNKCCVLKVHQIERILKKIAF